MVLDRIRETAEKAVEEAEERTGLDIDRDDQVGRREQSEDDSDTGIDVSIQPGGELETSEGTTTITGDDRGDSDEQTSSNGSTSRSSSGSGDTSNGDAGSDISPEDTSILDESSPRLQETPEPPSPREAFGPGGDRSPTESDEVIRRSQFGVVEEQDVEAETRRGRLQRQRERISDTPENARFEDPRTGEQFTREEALGITEEGIENVERFQRQRGVERARGLERARLGAEEGRADTGLFEDPFSAAVRQAQQEDRTVNGTTIDEQLQDLGLGSFSDSIEIISDRGRDFLLSNQDITVGDPAKFDVQFEEQDYSQIIDTSTSERLIDFAGDISPGFRRDLGATTDILFMDPAEAEIEFPVQETEIFEPEFGQTEDDTGELFSEIGEQEGVPGQALAVAGTIVRRPGATVASPFQERSFIEIVEEELTGQEEFVDQPSFPSFEAEPDFDSITEADLFRTRTGRTVTTSELFGDTVEPELETEFEEGRLLRGASENTLGNLIAGGTVFGRLARAGIPLVQSGGAFLTGVTSQQITEEVGTGDPEEAAEIFAEGAILGAASAPRNVPIPREQSLIRGTAQARRRAGEAAEDVGRFVRGDLGERPSEFGVITEPSGRPRDILIETEPRTRRDVLNEQIGRIEDAFIDQDLVFTGIPAPAPRTTTRQIQRPRTPERPRRPTEETTTRETSGDIEDGGLITAGFTAATPVQAAQQQEQVQRQRQEEEEDDLEIIDISERLAKIQALRDIEALKPDQTELLPEPRPDEMIVEEGFDQPDRQKTPFGVFTPSPSEPGEAEGMDDAAREIEDALLGEETGEGLDTDTGQGLTPGETTIPGQTQSPVEDLFQPPELRQEQRPTRQRPPLFPGFDDENVLEPFGVQEETVERGFARTPSIDSLIRGEVRAVTEEEFEEEQMRVFTGTEPRPILTLEDEDNTDLEDEEQQILNVFGI